MHASLACLMWRKVFWNTAIWSHLVVKGDTMCEYRYVISIRDYEVKEIPLFACIFLLYTSLSFCFITCCFVNPFIPTRRPQDRHFAALSCSWWSTVVFRKSIWHELTIRDTTLTKYRYNFGTSRDEVRIQSSSIEKLNIKCLGAVHILRHNKMTFFGPLPP